MRNDLPKGFLAGTAQAAFKKEGRQDLGVIFSQYPCVSAGLFTTNLFAAAPVQIDKAILSQGTPVRAIIGNSGQANSCTGEQGLKDCHKIQQEAGRLLGIEPNEVLLISTGVIGAKFKMEKWEKALPCAISDLGQKDAEGFTKAIMTTDAFPKFSSTEVKLSRGEARIAVMAKGAGMICPNMATMLCVCLTDAIMEKDEWQAMFNRAVNLTFNRVSVDGDTSTNDSILGLANGASGISLATADDAITFEKALKDILAQIAYMLVQDGEGASRVLHIDVSGAASDREAELAARAVGNSQLVKTAFYGGDGNWGRIINALGYSGAKLLPEKVGLVLCGIERFRAGQPVNDDREAELANLLKSRDIKIQVTLGDGPGSYSLLASDLGHEYVKLNSDYRS